MSVETYWLIVPLAGIVMTLPLWTWLLLTRPGVKRVVEVSFPPDDETPPAFPPNSTGIPEMSTEEKVDIVKWRLARGRAALRRLTQLGFKLTEEDVKRELRREQEQQQQ